MDFAEQEILKNQTINQANQANQQIRKVYHGRFLRNGLHER